MYGLERPINKTPVSLLDSVTELMTTKLFAICDATEQRHRLDMPAEFKIRPVIFKLIDFCDKIRMLRDVSKLKGTETFVNEYFSPRIWNIRNELWLSTAEFWRNGAKVHLRYDHALVINDQYSWAATNNMLEKVFCPVVPTGLNWHVLNKSLSLLNINARNLVPQFSEFSCIAASYSPHVMCVTEAWSNDAILDFRILTSSLQSDTMR